MSISPYVFFSGDCADAFAHYHEILGGELFSMTHADLPPDAEAMPGAEPHHVMHASITLEGGALLMGSDDPTGDGGPRLGMSVCYSGPTPEESKRVFDELADGGQIEMPFEPTFWSRGFGGVRDRWGVSWLIDTEGEPGSN